MLEHVFCKYRVHKCWLDPIPTKSIAKSLREDDFLTTWGKVASQELLAGRFEELGEEAKLIRGINKVLKKHAMPVYMVGRYKFIDAPTKFYNVCESHSDGSFDEGEDEEEDEDWYDAK
jgi:hypothetical protein